MQFSNFLYRNYSVLGSQDSVFLGSRNSLFLGPEFRIPELSFCNPRIQGLKTAFPEILGL